MKFPPPIEILRGEVDGLDRDGNEISFWLEQRLVSLKVTAAMRGLVVEGRPIELAARRSLYSSKSYVALAVRSEDKGAVVGASRAAYLFGPTVAALALLFLAVLLVTGIPEKTTVVAATAVMVSFAAYDLFQLSQIRRAVTALESLGARRPR